MIKIKSSSKWMLAVALIVGGYIDAAARSKDQELIRNIDFIEATEISKYDWEDPAAKHLVLDGADGPLTEREIEGLKRYVLNAWLPTHNSMNYYFRKRMNSYMIEWLYRKDGDVALLNRAIEIARRAVAYRNDNIGKVDDRFTRYPISFDRSVAPVWPNYKELEVYEDGSHGLAPGASGFAGMPMIAIPVRMIANDRKLWDLEYEGRTYREIALELAAEVQRTLDYTYEVFVGEDDLIRYPNTMQRSEWHGNVFIYNRVFPVMSGAIVLAEAYEAFGILQDMVAKIDSVNQAMIDFLTADMVFRTVNGVECVSYPYSDEAREGNPDQSEDFTHGSFDSRDFQLFYRSGRYGFAERYVKAMANTLVEALDKGNGEFAERLNGKGKVKKGTPISYDGYIWYAAYRPEVYKIIIDHILEKGIAKSKGVYDAYCVYEILKLKEARSDRRLRLVYSNDFANASSLEDWAVEGPGRVSIENGQLRLESAYAKATQEYLAGGGLDVTSFVEDRMIKDIGVEGVRAFYQRGKFQDAHFVCWNRFETPENYVLECSFRSVSDYPLHMIMFSHLGLNGESVFDPALKPRDGIAAQYTKGDMVGYRISYFHPERSTANLRKSPEQVILATGPDVTDEAPGSVHTLRITKLKNEVSWEVDGFESFKYLESDPKKALGGGYFAIRLMNPAMGLYDNIKVYEIPER